MIENIKFLNKEIQNLNDFVIEINSQIYLFRYFKNLLNKNKRRGIV